MRWNELTANELMMAKEQTKGVCLLPLGVMEKHGTHLPVGIDYMKAWRYADMAAALETAVVFPEYYIGNVQNCSFANGTIALPTNLVMQMLEGVCSEIARNGFKKIILVNAHGGNIRFLELFLDGLTEKNRDYCVYLCPLHGERTSSAIQKLIKETGCECGHGGGYETAVALYLFPELVKMKEILPREEGLAKSRSVALESKNIKTSMSWFMKYPQHLAGYGGDVSAAYGEEICKAAAEDIAEIVRIVKNDSLTMELQKEFYLLKGIK